MKASRHAALSVPVSAAVFALSRSIPAAIAVMVGGVLIDLDHVFDYVREYGFRIDIAHFFETFYHTRYRRIVLLFHAWELMIALGLIASATGWNPWLWGLTIGASTHLALDQTFNYTRPGSYFLLWRLAKGFQREKIIRQYPYQGAESDDSDGNRCAS